MHFSQVKLPVSAAPSLRNCPVHTVAPFALMIAPVYVFMRRNNKFVAVKAPLDFFTPEEIERLRPMGSVFFPLFVDSALQFREAARHIRALIRWEPGEARGGGDAISRELALSPTPFEISDSVLKITAPLWGPRLAIEPFFAAVFSNEICELFSEERLRKARDRSVEFFECALFRSGWAVFLALQLGYCDLCFLNRLRDLVFDATMEEASPGANHRTVFDLPLPQDVRELIAFVWFTIDSSKTRILESRLFYEMPGRITEKLAGRMNRIRKEFASQLGKTSPSIFGPGGFIDV